MCNIERSRDVGVPVLKCNTVALSAASPRSFLAVGFPLQSLTQQLFHFAPTQELIPNYGDR
jgi:hypothetical protein